MKNNKNNIKYMLYDDINYISEEQRQEYYKEYLQDMEMTSEDFTIEQYEETQADCNIEDLKNELQEQDKHDKYIVFGTLGLWDGEKAGYTTIKTLDGIFNLLYDYSKIFVDRWGTLKVETIHHDGRNYYTIKALKKDIVESVKDTIYYNNYMSKEELKRLYKNYTCNFWRE